MAKDPAHMTHAERMAMLAHELHSPSVVTKADKLLELINHEWRDIYTMRESAAMRHSVSEPAPSKPAAVPPKAEASPKETTSQERSGQSGVKTIAELADLYRNDKDYAGLRFRTRVNYDNLIRRILRVGGDLKLSDLKANDIQSLYDGWTQNGTIKLSLGHSLITMLRGLVHYGMKELKDPQCERLSMVLHNMDFKMVKPRTKLLTVEQAINLIRKANSMGLHSIALAQAFQTDCRLGQKDVIGEWVPISEDGESDVVNEGLKWIRGLRWEEIDNLVLRHISSNGGELFEYPLRNAPRVMEELKRFAEFPKRGPVIIRDFSDVPWTAVEFRRQWRKIARKCGIPDEVKNMDAARARERGNGESMTRADEVINVEKDRATGDLLSVARH
jgi:hypothetical protein